MAIGHSILKILTLKCREAAELTSASMDGELTPVDRWALRLHLLVCTACRRYRRHLRAMRGLLERAAKHLEDGGDLPGPPLPEGLRQRLRGTIEAGEG